MRRSATRSVALSFTVLALVMIDGALPARAQYVCQTTRAHCEAAPGLATSPADSRDALRAALLRAAAQQAPDTTTVVAKRMNGRNASVVVDVTTKKVSPLLADATRLTDPWLRAIMMSPSVNNFLSITSLDTRDFRILSAMMVKPSNSVMMTFAADPNPGLEYTHFTGSAAVFIPTLAKATGDKLE
jgi:hypothetical protein